MSLSFIGVAVALTVGRIGVLTAFMGTMMALLSKSRLKRDQNLYGADKTELELGSGVRSTYIEARHMLTTGPYLKFSQYLIKGSFVLGGVGAIVALIGFGIYFISR